jgi:hypothetical protein
MRPGCVSTPGAVSYSRPDGHRASANERDILGRVDVEKDEEGIDRMMTLHRGALGAWSITVDEGLDVATAIATGPSEETPRWGGVTLGPLQGAESSRRSDHRVGARSPGRVKRSTKGLGHSGGDSSSTLHCQQSRRD